MIENFEQYYLVKKSKLFDFDYYSKKSNLNFDTYSKALFHYLEIGYKLGYNPNEYFNGNEYLNTHSKINMNPLVHYLEYKDGDERVRASDSKKRILYVLHYSGGVEYAVSDLADSVSDEFECFILKSDMNKLILYRLNNNNSIILKEFELTCPWHSKLLHSSEYKQIYNYILFNYNIDLVEIDHLLFHTLDLPDIANALDIPQILIIHDYYYICPVFVLLDENYNYCGGYCDNDEKNCGIILEWFYLPKNIVEWKEKWQKEMEILFGKFDVIVTSMSFTKNMFLSHYSSLKKTDIQLIEPGRDLIKYDNLNSVPVSNQPIKILIPGFLLAHKGSEFIKELKKMDINNRLELHFLGYVDDELEKMGKYHGEYVREDFAKYVEKIKPSFIGLFSITPETYSYTLTEALSVGVPVIASNLGVLKERVEKNACGWLIDINDPKKAYLDIIEISKNKDAYTLVKNHIDKLKLKTTDKMAFDYKKLYNNLVG